jgi:hypothetical protein
LRNWRDRRHCCTVRGMPLGAGEGGERAWEDRSAERVGGGGVGEGKGERVGDVSGVRLISLGPVEVRVAGRRMNKALRKWAAVARE